MRARAEPSRARPESSRAAEEPGSRAHERYARTDRAHLSAPLRPAPPRAVRAVVVARLPPTTIYGLRIYALAPSESERDGIGEGERGEGDGDKRHTVVSRSWIIQDSGPRPRANAPSVSLKRSPREANYSNFFFQIWSFTDELARNLYIFVLNRKCFLFFFCFGVRRSTARLPREDHFL